MNQLDDVDNAQDLAWLPESFAPGVRVVLSTLAGAPLDEIRRRGFPEAVVAPLTAVEKREVIQKYLEFYGKELSEARTARLCAAGAASNPLFLRALLDELRQFGSYSRLDERLGLYLQAQVPEDLFGMILERYETDYERERPGLVRDACSFLLAARRGLSEAELLDVTGGPEGPLPHLYWSPLFLAAESSLVTRSGLLNFAHDHIRRAANRRYGGGRGAHDDLAAYFRAREPGRRKAEELPWQLQQAERWDALRDVLLDPPFLADIWEVNRTDLKRYWANLESRAGLNPAREYQPFLDQCERLGQYGLFVANLLDDSGYPNEAGRIYEYLADHVQDPKSYAGILGNLALLRKRSGDLDGAYELHKREEAICREQKDDEGLQRSLNHQAQILSLQGKRRDALELHKEEEAVARGRGDSVGLAACLGNQAIIQRKLGNTDEALALHREEEQLYRSAGDRMGVQDALFNQAIVYWQKGEFERGLGMYVDRERQARELGDRRWLAKAVGMQGVVHQSVGRFNQAFDCFEEQARICREIHDWTDWLSALNNAGRILVKLGRHREALARLAELERLCRERESPGALQACLQNQGEAYLAGDDAKRALGCFEEQERICERIGDLPGLGAAIGCQGLAWQRLGRGAQAMALRKREEAIARQLDDPDMLQVSLTYQAELRSEAGDYDAAFAMYSAADDIARRIHAWDGLRVSLGMSGALHEQLGHNAEALAAYREQQQLARDVGNRYAEERALRNQARVLVAMNDLDGALLATRQLETLATDPTDGAREAVNQAAILDEMDRHAEAVDAARRALDLLGAVDDGDDITAIRELAHEILDEKAEES